MCAYPSLEERLDLYLGKPTTSISSSSINYSTADEYNVIISSPHDNFAAFWQSLDCYETGLDWRARFSEDVAKSRWQAYVEPITKIYTRLGMPNPFFVKAIDNRMGFDIPVYVKSCSIKDANSSRFLLPLDYNRHWAYVGEVSKHDSDFTCKKSVLFWRGVTTGSFSKARGYSSRYHLARQLCDGHFGHNNFDIGFSDVVQLNSSNSDIPVQEIRNKCIAPKASIAQHLECKYLLSLEGNDVASGLKWMLASNSIVIMPKPEVETWACESYLKPYIHYVPISADLHDLQHQLDWCESNKNECIKIAQNGKSFIAAFSDPASELQIAEQIARSYNKSCGFEEQAS